jgi:hypothetical protein
MSTTRQLRGLLVLLTVLVAMVAAGGAAASPPSTASGTIANTTATFNSVRSAGGNLIIDLSATAAYTGTFSGTSTLHGVLIIHPDGSANFHDVEVFTGTVNGVAGTVTFDLTGRNDSSLAVDETRTIIDAGGGLDGLHGVLHETGVVVFPTGPVTTYSGKIG